MKGMWLASLPVAAGLLTGCATGPAINMELGSSTSCGGAVFDSAPPSRYKWEELKKDEYRLVISTSLVESGRAPMDPDSVRVSQKGNLLTVTIADRHLDEPQPPCLYRRAFTLVIDGLEASTYHVIFVSAKRFFVSKHLFIDDPANVD